MLASPMRTPIAKRSTPETDAAARAPARPRPTYSDQPVCLIDESALPASRFLNPSARRLPYRDASGRVNVHLCQRSLTLMDPAVDDAAACNTLVAWDRHARRAIASRPTDENRTLNDLAEAEEKEEREREAMPLSQRKPRRGGAVGPAGDETVVVLDAPERHERRRHRALRECMLEEEEAPADEDDGSRSVASSSSSAAMRLAPGTITMQRRLFRPPKPEDEPSVDLLYLRTIAEDRKRKRGKRAAGRPSSSSLEEASSEEEDVYEVSAILKEDVGTGRFLIRWEGYGPDADTWEPEEHVAPQLVAAFREKRRLETSHAGDDYMLGRSKRLWCATCGEHRPHDCFSSQQRRLAPAARCCLNHHYKVGGGGGGGRLLDRSPGGSKSPAGGKTPIGGKRGREESSPGGPPPLPKRLSRPATDQFSPRRFTLPELAQ